MVPVGIGNGEQVSFRRVAGVVDDRVDPAESADRGIHQAAEHIRIGYRPGVADGNLRAKLTGKVGGTTTIGQQCQSVAVASQAPGDAGANALAGGSNDRD